MSFEGSIQMIFFSMLTCTIGSEGSPNKMVAAHFLNNSSSIEPFLLYQSIAPNLIEHFHKWLRICYSFVFMLIRPTGLTLV